MSEEKKKYRVTNPVAWGGRRERGEVLELTATEAVEIGEVELIPEAAPITPATEAVEAEAPAPTKKAKQNTKS